MLRTPDEEDIPLRHRPLPSVDIALLPHELRALRMQRLAVGGGAFAVIALVIGLTYGRALLRRDPHDDKSASELNAASDPEPARAPTRDTAPISLRGSALAQTVPAMRASLPVVKSDPEALAFGALARIEHKFGSAKSWKEALVRGGASGAEADEIIAALGKLVDFRRGKPDDLFIFERDADKTLHAFEYRASVTEIYRASRSSESGALRGVKVLVPIESRRIARGTYIAGTLGHSLSALGLGPSLASSVIEAFDTKVTFTRDTRAGDSVKLIVNEEYVDGNFLRYTPVQAVEYSSERLGKLQAFWFEPTKGDGEFFDPSGRAVHGGWIRTPLRYDHISSPYNLRRRHPILKRIVPHLGIDYSASTGTPVTAAADGVISFAGPRGPNGNLVSIKHNNGFESHYAHLWRIGPGIKPGVKVTQRQSIGFVGSTGRSTGPHLHFALKRYGKFLDPASQLNGPGEMLPAAHLPAFRANVQRLRAELEHIPLAEAPSTEDLPKADEPGDEEDLDL
ncbi:MAG TPA: M23 family metallopeptidase [Polyangiales bacterium]|nr:M23 family metallopeptidase [Polyangiales bacterium]